MQVTLALTDPPAGGGPSRLGGSRVMAISDALAERYDIAISACWQASVRLFEVDASRHASFVQRLEHHHMSAWQAERIAAAISYDLPVDFLAASERVADELAQLRPDARCVLIARGVAKDVFAAGAGGAGGPLRVAAAKGEETRAILAAMTESHEAEIADPSADAACRAACFAACDVALVLDDERAAHEAMHAGAACVATLDDVVAHGDDGLVIAPGDARDGARALDLLARDRELLARLRAGALTTAQGVPSLAEASAEMARALRRLVVEPVPEAVSWPVRLMADVTAAVAVFDIELHAYVQELETIRSDEAYVLATRARKLLDRPRMQPARRLVRAARRRLG